MGSVSCVTRSIPAAHAGVTPRSWRPGLRHLPRWAPDGVQRKTLSSIVTDHLLPRGRFCGRIPRLRTSGSARGRSEEQLEDCIGRAADGRLDLGSDPVVAAQGVAVADHERR